MLRTLLAALVSAPFATAALACGGGEWAYLDAALTPAFHHVEGWLADDPFDDVDANPATRFLYAARTQDPPVFDALDQALGWGDPPAFGGGVPAADAAFHAALDKGDYDAALKAARDVVEAVLDLPLPLAEPYGEQLRLAVEFIEVRSLLVGAPKGAVAAWFASTSAPTAGLPAALAAVASVRTTAPASAVAQANVRHARAASVRWLAIRHALATEVPDGWTTDDIRAAKPDGFGALQARIEGWLKDFPNHPLADFVRLKSVRVAYLANDADLAWSKLLDLYTRHPARAANEMRFLVVQEVLPTRPDLAKYPPEIAAGLATEVTVSDASWSALWKQTELHPEAPWALRVQERLLIAALREQEDQPGAPLPSAFPGKPAAPSDGWARLRLGALMTAGRVDDAIAQLKASPSDPFYAPMAAQLALAKGDWAGAIRTPGLDGDAMRYLLRVLAPAEVVRGLIDDENPEIRWEARLSVATRDLHDTRRWAAGAAGLEPVDPERAALWREADALSRGASPKKQLQFARFLREHGGQLFIRNEHWDVVWYRSLPVARPPEDGAYSEARAGITITPAEEWALTEAWLKRSFSTWYAINTYADLLADHGQELGVKGGMALDEADAAYNVLLNYGSGDWYAWGSILPESDAAKKIRAFGLWYRYQ